jgi:hypothetical protein
MLWPVCQILFPNPAHWARVCDFSQFYALLSLASLSPRCAGDQHINLTARDKLIVLRDTNAELGSFPRHSRPFSTHGSLIGDEISRPLKVRFHRIDGHDFPPF